MRIDRDFGERIIQEAKKTGCDSAEVFMTSGKGTTVEIKGGEIDALDRDHYFGYAIRVINAERPGFSYSTQKEAWKETLERAIKGAQLSDPDPYLDIASPEDIPFIETFDEKISSLDTDFLADMVRLIESSAFEFDPRIKKIRKASGSLASSEVLLINSKGVNASYKSTSLSGQIMVVAEDGNDSQMGWGYDIARFFDDIDFPSIGRDAARRATELLGAKGVTPLRGEVLFENHISTEFLGVLASAFSSENVQKGKSLLAGKVGSGVVSEKINLIDNGLLKGAVGSRPFDGEGIPTGKTTLISKGVLQGFLYNIKTARKEKRNSTGNAVRGGIESLPSVGINNLFLEASAPEFSHKREELIGMIKRGIIVTEVMGIHTANPISGDFSIGVTGLWVEDGHITHPVKEAAISGNLLDLFKKIVAVGKEIRFYGKIGAPEILFEGIDISG